MPPKTADPAVRKNPYPDGRVDATNRRSDADAMQGHFVVIDLRNRRAREGVEAAVGETSDNSAYAVYDRPASLDENGWPLEAFCALRDEHGGAIVRVPYSALIPSQAGRRS